MANYTFEIRKNGDLFGAGWGGFAIHCTQRDLTASIWLDGREENFQYAIHIEGQGVKKSGYGKPEIPTRVSLGEDEFEFHVFESPEAPSYPGVSDPVLTTEK